MTRTNLACSLVLILLCASFLPATEKDRVIELRFIPQESTGSSSPSPLAAILAKPVKLEFEDARVLKDVSQVGDGTGDDDELFAWRASSSIPDFAREVFIQTAAGWGVASGAGAEVTFNVRLTRFWVGERDQAVGSTYAAETHVTGTFKDAGGKPIMQVSGSGEAHRYGRKRSAENCMEVLSDALKQAFANLMTEQAQGTSLDSTAGGTAMPSEPVTPASLLGELLKLRSSGFGAETLIQYVNQQTLSAAFTTSDMIAWKDAGLSEELLRLAMGRPVAGKSSPP